MIIPLSALIAIGIGILAFIAPIPDARRWQRDMTPDMSDPTEHGVRRIAAPSAEVDAQARAPL